MASTTPVLQQISWPSLVPQIVIGVLLFQAAEHMGADNPVMAAAIVYVAALFSLRWLVAFHHRMGMRNYKKGNFEKAMGYFEKSHDFFRRHPWIDKYRYITLLSSTRISYREMALLNIAFCHGQIGNGRESKEFYESALAEFPDSEIAKAALRMIASTRNLPRE